MNDLVFQRWLHGFQGVAVAFAIAIILPLTAGGSPISVNSRYQIIDCVSNHGFLLIYWMNGHVRSTRFFLLFKLGLVKEHCLSSTASYLWISKAIITAYFCGRSWRLKVFLLIKGFYNTSWLAGDSRIAGDSQLQVDSRNPSWFTRYGIPSNTNDLWRF